MPLGAEEVALYALAPGTGVLSRIVDARPAGDSDPLSFAREQLQAGKALGERLGPPPWRVASGSGPPRSSVSATPRCCTTWASWPSPTRSSTSRARSPRRGDAIPVASRIILACDAYNAMITTRPYRVAMSEADAVAELRAKAGSQFDPTVVCALLDLLEPERVAGLVSAAASVS